MKIDLILCIDIGGTHITTAVIESGTLAILQDSLTHRYVDSQASRDHILQQWNEAIEMSIGSIEHDIATMLVSIPGPFDYEKGICLMDGMHKYQSLLHMDVRHYLSTNFYVPKEDIFFFNDAHAFLLGEVYHHKWNGNKVVGLTLGTGLGSAWYDGMAPRDLNYGSASFREGITEDYISTRGIIDFLAARTDKKFNNIKELVEEKEADSSRQVAFSFLATALVEFIQMYITPLNPDVIVIGGSIAKAHTFFIEDVRKATTIPIVIASMDEVNLFYGMITTLDI